MSINRRADKEDVVYISTQTATHTHNEILLRHKKEGIFTICTNIDGLGGYCAKCSKSDDQAYVAVWMRGEFRGVWAHVYL